MAEICLVALNSKYIHSSFGLRYLYANLGPLRERARILEFTIGQGVREIAERILEDRPRIVGLGVYIWNARLARELVSLLKKLSPETIVVLGGPEVSHETERQEICRLADYTIRGEADFLFRELCEGVLERGEMPAARWISGELPEVSRIASPYLFYSDEDIRNRVIYVEASRGCPYKCEYCLSSLDKSVRGFDLEAFLSDMDRLIAQGARQFKFIDRTFNLNLTTCRRILGFFLERIEAGLFIHFEMVPDRLPEEIRDLIRRFPPGALQFEIGVQTWNPEVSKLVSRRQDFARIRENFGFLRRETGVHTHADLIVGLPGETLESFGRGFDALLELAPDEIQVGILKRLRGTPISRHDGPWAMAYEEDPPYCVLRTRTMSFGEIQEMVRFARHWDLVGNSGNFKRTLGLFREIATEKDGGSFFSLFRRFSRHLTRRHPQGNGIALLGLVESTWVFLREELPMDPEPARLSLLEDYTGTVKRDVPIFLRGAAPSGPAPQESRRPEDGLTHLPSRQRRHRLAERAGS